MSNSRPFNNAVLEREMLEAKLTIDEYFLSLVVKDIYENTGQQLSAVRVQLALLERKAPVELTPGLQETGKLVSQLIAGLRTKSNDFSTGPILSPGSNFVNAIKTAIDTVNALDNTIPTNLSGIPFDIKETWAIILFSGVIKIISLLKLHRSRITHCKITYTKKRFQLKFIYQGTCVDSQELSRINSHFFQVTHSRKTEANKNCIMLKFENVS